MFSMIKGKLMSFAGVLLGIAVLVIALLSRSIQSLKRQAAERKLEREKQANKVNEAVIRASVDGDERETELDEKYKVNTDRFDIK